MNFVNIYSSSFSIWLKHQFVSHTKLSYEKQTDSLTQSHTSSPYKSSEMKLHSILNKLWDWKELKTDQLNQSDMFGNQLTICNHLELHIDSGAKTKTCFCVKEKLFILTCWSSSNIKNYDLVVRDSAFSMTKKTFRQQIEIFLSKAVMEQQTFMCAADTVVGLINPWWKNGRKRNQWEVCYVHWRTQTWEASKNNDWTSPEYYETQDVLRNFLHLAQNTHILQQQYASVFAETYSTAKVHSQTEVTT